MKEEDKLNRLLKLVSNHGHKDLSQNCEVCIEIKQLKHQILQDHEYAKKLHRLLSIHKEKDLFTFNKNIHDWKQIVKRLKEFVKNDPMPSNMQFQLQKILEGKK